jgi:hypothetical protein
MPTNSVSEQEARLVELAEVAALRAKLDTLATLEVRECAIEAEVAAFKLRATAERRAQLQRAVTAAQREHALVASRQAERDRAAAAENVRHCILQKCGFSAPILCARVVYLYFESYCA